MAKQGNVSHVTVNKAPAAEPLRLLPQKGRFRKVKEWLRRFLEWFKKALFFGLEGEEVAVHCIKCDPDLYEDVKEGFPSFVITRNDKKYEPGDFLVLKEYDEEAGTLTGRTVRTSIMCIEDENVGLKPGYCVLGIEKD